MFHQDVTRALIAQWGPLVMAELRLETSGQYAGAVRLWVGDDIVASIPHEDAEPFREIVREANTQGLPATCRIAIEDDGEWLDIWVPNKLGLSDTHGAFFSGLGEIDVSLDPGEAERIDASLNSKAKNKRLRRLGELFQVENTWRVRLDDKRAGSLPKGSYAYIEQASAEGFPLTCDVLIVRQPGRPLRVTAEVPDY